jgi:hypothetical protein
MKCAEVQKKVYLFNELDLHQQQEIEAHLNACSDCKRVFDQAGHLRQIMQRIAPATPTLHNSGRFTSQVMSAIDISIHRPLRTSLLNAIAEYLSLRLVKYSMASLSILFIGFFLVEFVGNTHPAQSAQVTQTGRLDPARLNTASFFQQFQKVKTESQTRSLLSQCLIDCMHTPRLDCSSCKTKYLNLIKHHEKI